MMLRKTELLSGKKGRTKEAQDGHGSGRQLLRLGMVVAHLAQLDFAGCHGTCKHSAHDCGKRNALCAQGAHGRLAWTHKLHLRRKM